mgnify:CR=1 FL=1
MLCCGHLQVTSLAMSPVDDYFLSSSGGADRSVCLWSLASPAPVARLDLPPDSLDPKVAYTHDGLLFGVMVTVHGQDSSFSSAPSTSNCIRLFDARSYDKGPFLQLIPTQSQLERALKIAQPFLEPAPLQRLLAASRWESFCFSPDGTRALVSTSSGMLISLDAFDDNGDPIVFFTEERNTDRGDRTSAGGLQPCSSPSPSLGYCFTPDSKQVLAGTEDKTVRVYDSQTGRPLGALQPGGGKGGGAAGDQPSHVSAVTSVRCNPKYEVIATSGFNTMLWLKSSLYKEEKETTSPEQS